MNSKNVKLPTGEIESIFPKESTEVTRKFFSTKAKLQTLGGK